MAHNFDSDAPREGRKPPQVALTIAGYDPSNGAGITADLQVFAAHGLFGVSAITAYTVQSTLGVAAVEPVDPQTLRNTLQHLVSDFNIAGVKIGMLGSRDAAVETAAFLRSIHLQGLPVVLDPVLRSSSGTELLDFDGVGVLKKELLPLVHWVTPNWAELGVLVGREIEGPAQMMDSLQELGKRYPGLNIVATGGDLNGEPVDVWRSHDDQITELRGRRVETTSTHGTGCAYSSALLSALVCGQAPGQALRTAKDYVEGALRRAPGLGHGRGPMDLTWPWSTRH